MDFQYQVITASNNPTTEAFAIDVKAGLMSSPTSLPSKYFYDDRGSSLFESICAQDNYYVYNCELGILESCIGKVAGHIRGRPFRLVGLGEGDASKTRIILRALLDEQADFIFQPVDICEPVVRQLGGRLHDEFANTSLHVQGIVADYEGDMQWLTPDGPILTLVLFLGSNIGNLNKDERRMMLQRIGAKLRTGDFMLIGFDLKKDPRVLMDAYNDEVTAEFNFNLLDRINRELGGNFDRTRFSHAPCYNDVDGCMESWLVSLADQDVHIKALDCSFHFEKHQRIHTENSFKFDYDQIERLASGAGFSIVENYVDDKGYFVDSLWRVI